MASIFTRIINGEIPCYKIAEDDRYFAFLDINPNAPGHTLCIPKQEVDRLMDLDPETYSGLMDFARTIGQALEKTVPCKRVGMAVIGLEVPHVHVHLIPMRSMADMTFGSKTAQTPEQFEAMAASIRKALEA